MGHFRLYNLCYFMPNRPKRFFLGVNIKSTYKVLFISISTFYKQNPPPAD